MKADIDKYNIVIMYYVSQYSQIEYKCQATFDVIISARIGRANSNPSSKHFN